MRRNGVSHICVAARFLPEAYAQWEANVGWVAGVGRPNRSTSGGSHATPKCSILEVAQAIGRALRQHPGEGRTATAKTPTDGANAGSD
ncbi:hypothetical protein ACIRL2_26805 [Embleya sp. NPDC127516]|uniref:hypothetical protein n=1 Tax=Embleya sp. NPDC127516 TaxID=3363990 RepID=UPI00380E4460